MKKFIIFVTFILSFFIFNSTVLALPNNKFGIHITQMEDIPRAKELVDSQGGDWGYVTIVIQNTDRNFDKWQKSFDILRENHLIPIVRLATHLDKNIWVKPDIDDMPNWANFLNSLNWPVKTRYVVIYNEPNHIAEWGGEVNPGYYAKVLTEAINAFKQKSADFFILNAGFDQAASNSQETMDESLFLETMNREIPGIFGKLDGWATHSYPNHGFVGKPWETGKATIVGYNWELSYLKSLGLNKELPIFITETGWPHKIISNLKFQISNFYDEQTVADYITQAFQNVWLPDNQIIAVTPFILNYPYYPFENFSWLDSENSSYPQYEAIKNLPKIKGEVVQEEKYKVVNTILPPILPTNFKFEGKLTLKNTGQSIWGEKQFELESTSSGNLRIIGIALNHEVLVKPGEKATFDYSIQTGSQSGTFSYSWGKLPLNSIRIFKAPTFLTQKPSFLNNLFLKILKFLITGK